jgi:hypothetical protein
VDQQFCQTCRREGRWLEYSSEQASVNYYRCAGGHVWLVPKNNPKAAQTHVTLEDAPANPFVARARHAERV